MYVCFVVADCLIAFDEQGKPLPVNDPSYTNSGNEQRFVYANVSDWESSV